MRTTSDRQPHPPSRRRGWLVVALVAVLVGAFAVQATSTWRLGQAHHLADIALPALILMLEVGSTTGAALYVLTRNGGTRVRAGLLVAIATGVGATGGVQAYGFIIGLPVAAVLLLLVDTIGRYWHEPATSTTSETASAGESAENAPEPTADQGVGAAESASNAPDNEPDDEPAEVADEPELAPVDEPNDDVLPPVAGVAPEIVARAAWLLDDEPRAGRPRLIRELSVTDHQARKLLDALRPVRVVKGAS